MDSRRDAGRMRGLLSSIVQFECDEEDDLQGEFRRAVLGLRLQQLAWELEERSGDYHTPSVDVVGSKVVVELRTNQDGYGAVRLVG